MVYIAADAVLANFGIESLKQLNEAIGNLYATTGSNDIVVAATLSIDAPAGQPLPRYIFNKCSGSNLGQSLKCTFPAPSNMTEEESLASFLSWVYARKECKDSKNFALILWSHGPELFLQPPPGLPTGASGSLYLTPVELRGALETSPPPGNLRKLDIVGFDACSMSMFEMAYELRKVAKYMVASQVEVPDLSFPYGSLVDLFKQYGNNIRTLLRKGVCSYQRTYQDYITSSITQMQPVTLAALDLGKCTALHTAIKNLAKALIDSIDDPDLPAFLLAARQNSRDYVGGLYVDLLEFCTYLRQQLYPSAAQTALQDQNLKQGQSAARPQSFGIRAVAEASKGALGHKTDIRNACLSVMKALHVREDGSSDGLILQNCTSDTRSHGISIYFPYLTDEEASDIEQPLVKGTSRVPAKGFTLALNASSTSYLFAQRHDLITLTESYYPQLQLALDTHWYEFLTRIWTKTLITLEPDDLDLRYSGVQSAVNMLYAMTIPIPPRK